MVGEENLEEPQHTESAPSGGAGSPAAAPAQGEETTTDVRATREQTDWMVVLAVVAFLAGAAWLVYGRAIHAPFIFDDRNSVAQNSSIIKLMPLLGEPGRGGPLAPLKDTVTAGRPVVNFSLALNYYFGRLTPTGYHVFNLVVHVLSAALLWAIVARTLRLPCFAGRFVQVAGPLAFAVALVWALHPLQTEAVEYVSQRTELLMALFYLATLLASVRYWTAVSPAARSGWLVLATIACALGMACKEVMVTAPVVVLLYDRAFIAGSFRRAWRDSRSLYVGLALGWLVLFALNITGPRSASAGFRVGVTAPAWWMTQCEVLAMYLKLVFWPWPLVIHYDLPYHQSLATGWPWVLFVALLVSGTLFLLGKNYAAGFLGACALLILSPTLLVPIPSEVAAERRMYLPLAALATVAIVGGYALAERILRASKPEAEAATIAPTVMKGTVIAAVLVAALFAVGSVRRLASYRDQLTIWEDAAIHQPDNVVVLVNLGASLTGAGRFEEAIKALRHAKEIAADSAALGINKQLGTALYSAGRSQEAIPYLQTAIELAPNAPGVERVLGIALINSQRAPEAVEHLERAVKQQPNDAEVHDNLGAALLNADRRPEAIESFQRALGLNPKLIGAQANLAFAYAKSDRPKEAIAAAEQAQQMAREQGTPAATAQLDAWLQAYRNEQAKP